MQRGDQANSEESNMSKHGSGDLGELPRIILGFIMALYGFLALVAPERYPIDGIPSVYTPLIGLILLVFGIVLLTRKG
jgi:hypothetical protein